MSVVKTVLKVRKVQEKVAIAEVAKVNSVMAAEVEVSQNLSSFLDEYSVEKSLLGRKIKKDELLNQTKFTATIVRSQFLQDEKIQKLKKITLTRVTNLGNVQSQVKSLQARDSELAAEKSRQVQQKEDAFGAELYSSRKFYKC